LRPHEIADLFVHAADVVRQPVEHHLVGVQDDDDVAAALAVFALQLGELVDEARVGLFLGVQLGIADLRHVGLFVPEVLFGVLVQEFQHRVDVFLRPVLFARLEQFVRLLEPDLVLVVNLLDAHRKIRSPYH